LDERRADVVDDIERGSQRVGLYMLATGLTTMFYAQQAQRSASRMRAFIIHRCSSVPALQTETIDQPRRRFVGSAAMTIAAAQLGMIASAAAQTGKTASKVPAIKPETNTSFKSLKQINAGLLCTAGRTTLQATRSATVSSP
jgi:hypothetical protein